MRFSGFLAAAMLLVVASSLVAAQQQQSECSQRYYHNDCHQDSTCMQFDGKCATSCSPPNPSIDPSCSTNPLCVVVDASQNMCRPNCSAITANDGGGDLAARCVGTDGCFAFKLGSSSSSNGYSCIAQCAGSDPYYNIPSEAECNQLSTGCWWQQSSSSCRAKCSIATDPISCGNIDSSSDTCSWDYLTKQCVVRCQALTSGGEAECTGASSGGRCQWLDKADPNAFAGGCLPKCSRAQSVTDCELLSESSCVWVSDTGSAADGGSCRLACNLIPVNVNGGGTMRCTDNTACGVADDGTCQTLSCFRISNEQFCSSSGNCQFIDGKCIRACGMYRNFKGSGGVSSCQVSFQGVTLCSMVNVTTMGGGHALVCQAPSCDDLAASSSTTEAICMSQHCVWAQGKCRGPLCDGLTDQASCNQRSFYCGWNPTAGQGQQCFSKCDVLDTMTACGQAQWPAGCEWRAVDITKPRGDYKCFRNLCAMMSSNPSQCAAQQCKMINITAMRNTCTQPCEQHTTGETCMFRGCLWDPVECTCSDSCPWREATAAACSSHPPCKINEQFGICGFDPSWRPDTTCAKDTPAPTSAPATVAPSNGNNNNGNSSGNDNNNNGTGGASGNNEDSDSNGVKPGVIGGAVAAAVVFVAIVAFAVYKYREDQALEALANLPEQGSGTTTRKRFVASNNVQLGPTVTVEYIRHEDNADAGMTL